ncbi:MAG: hypothetical protein K9J28_07040 [Sulfuritalea sp.]|nr:hypothetical protein [Sulfuritalea sp.]
MESKQNPFSFYDFLGYFTPGAIFLYSFILITPHIHSLDDISEFLNSHHSIDKVEQYIPFVLSAYVIGHILSFLSSVTIEIYSIWSAGYPSKYLLKVPVSKYFEIQKPKRIKLTARVLLLLLLAPVTIFDFILGYCLKLREVYSKNLDPLLISLIQNKIVALLKENKVLTGKSSVSVQTDNYFRFVYHYCVENAPNHLPKMQNYVALYGFLRTLTFLSVLGFWTLTIFMFTNEVELTKGLGYLLFLSLCSYILFMAFTKFYRRFSLEAFMALTAIYPKK